MSHCNFLYIMKAGILLPQAGDSATRENILYIANGAEKEGLDSVWVFERLLWPLKPQTPYAGTSDGSLPLQYQTVLDPLETITYLAANTEQISLGTCLIDMLFHNPVILAICNTRYLVARTSYCRSRNWMVKR
jgi:alkanesulfonate monooxygenase SsuD/methylene tetrahydromethanopterin reductase-like flavin-dependent oxidoreductase (luciferase family)